MSIKTPKIEKAYRLVANTLRRQGFEVYSLPVPATPVAPHLIGYKGNVFYNVYIYLDEAEKLAAFTGDSRDKIFEYAAIMNAEVISALVQETTKPGLVLSLESQE